jgi:NAD(P)H-hydrate epimerase
MGAVVKARFVTEDGLAVHAVTAEQMRAIDRIAIEQTGPNLFQMMENAGRTLASQTIALLGAGWRGARVVVLAGVGGNGGGGICAARHLANRNVSVVLVLSEPSRLGEVPAFQRKIFGSTGGHDIGAAEVARERPDLIVDALVGYGLREAPRGRVADLIAWANASGALILSLDVPSGMNATTGECPGQWMLARVTLTLALPKSGLAVETAGALWLADLGIPRATYERAGVDYTDPFGANDRVRLSLSPAPLEHPAAERL